MSKIIRLLTEKEEAQAHLKDLQNSANTFDGCIRDIRKHTPTWLDTEEVEAHFRDLVQQTRQK